MDRDFDKEKIVDKMRELRDKRILIQIIKKKYQKTKFLM